jgi:hypothetical protein
VSDRCRPRESAREHDQTGADYQPAERSAATAISSLSRVTPSSSRPHARPGGDGKPTPGLVVRLSDGTPGKRQMSIPSLGAAARGARFQIAAHDRNRRRDRLSALCARSTPVDESDTCFHENSALLMAP